MINYKNPMATPFAVLRISMLLQTEIENISEQYLIKLFGCIDLAIFNESLVLKINYRYCIICQVLTTLPLVQ